MRKNYKILLIVLVCLVIIIGAIYGRKSYERHKAYKEDAVFLLDFLEKNYPYFEVKKKVFNDDFLKDKHKFIDKITKSKNDVEFWDNIQQTMLSLRNAHTHIVMEEVFLSQIYDKEAISKCDYWRRLMKKHLYLPDIKLKYVEGKYIVIKSKNKEIPIGSIVTKINGQEINEYIKSKKGKFFLSKDSKRNIFYSMWYEYYKINNSQDEVEVVCNGLKSNKKVKYNKINQEIADFYYSNSKDNTSNVITDKINNKKTAYLRIKSFSKKFYENDKKIIEGFFNNLNNVESLVIDIRGNGGGTDLYSNLLCSFLTDRSPKYYFCIRKTKFMQDRFCFLSEMDMKDLPKNNYNLDGFQALNINNNNKLSKVTNKFKGRVYILIDGAVYSASEHFVDGVKTSDKVKFIGTTTSGDGTGWGPIATYLPKSKIIIQMTPGLTINEDGTVNEEVCNNPDIYIEQSIDDYSKFLKSGLNDIIRTKYDTVYNKTLEIIKK